jgi:hypothetical protein
MLYAVTLSEAKGLLFRSGFFASLRMTGYNMSECQWQSNPDIPTMIFSMMNLTRPV